MPALPAFDADAFERSLESTPLFMTRLPDSTEADSNDALSALQALVYDGTPLEIAGNFKTQGNDAFAEKRWDDARDYYEKAILQLSDSASALKGLRSPMDWYQEGEEEEIPMDLAQLNPTTNHEADKDHISENLLISTCHSNLAAVNLERGNYKSALRNCKAALDRNPMNVKALYRSGKALFHLDSCLAGIDVVQHGLYLDPTNAALQNLKSLLLQRNIALNEKEKSSIDRVQGLRLQETQLMTVLKARNIKMEGSFLDVPHKITLQEDGTLTWPLLFLYPEFSQSDLVACFNDLQTFDVQLEEIFPLPWDTTSTTYTLSNLPNIDCYFETPQHKLVKFSPRLPLNKAVNHPKFVLRNGVVNVYVVARGPWAQNWIKTY